MDTAGYEVCRFDITLPGAGFTSLEVQVLFWNSRQSKWFGGATRKLESTGQHALVVPDARGVLLFLKIISFTGTSFNLSADYVLS